MMKYTDFLPETVNFFNHFFDEVELDSIEFDDSAKHLLLNRMTLNIFIVVAPGTQEVIGKFCFVQGPKRPLVRSLLSILLKQSELRLQSDKLVSLG